MADNVPSESEATRVSYPSSARIPAISSRMSISSSTTRISGATSDPFLFMPQPLLGLALLAHRKLHPDDGATGIARSFIEDVVEHELPTVVLKNLAHDGKAEARALGARRDIGFGQAVAMLCRQADAVVANAKHEAAALDHHVDNDAPRSRIASRDAGRDRFDGVLQHIGQRL